MRRSYSGFGPIRATYRSDASRDRANSPTTQAAVVGGPSGPMLLFQIAAT
ncbi:DUF6053 domain-containing protein [Lysobacter enzymogenes]